MQTCWQILIETIEWWDLINICNFQITSNEECFDYYKDILVEIKRGAAIGVLKEEGEGKEKLFWI